MPRYMTLISFTEQGVEHINDTVERADEFRSTVEEAGGKLLAQYWALGEIDGCVVFETPDDATASALLVSLASEGNVRTRTSQVFDAAEFKSILDKK